MGFSIWRCFDFCQTAAPFLGFIRLRAYILRPRVSELLDLWCSQSHVSGAGAWRGERNGKPVPARTELVFLCRSGKMHVQLTPLFCRRFPLRGAIQDGRKLLFLVCAVLRLLKAWGQGEDRRGKLLVFYISSCHIPWRSQRKREQNPTHLCVRATFHEEGSSLHAVKGSCILSW